MIVTKNLDDFRKKWISGQKTAFLARNSAQSGPFSAQKFFFWPEINFLSTSSNFFVTIMTRHQKDNFFVLLMLLSELQGACKSPFLAQKWPKNQIFMLSIVLHGIVWYRMEFLCILWYPIVFMSFHCIVWYCFISYGIAWYCIVGFGARAVSRKTPIYFMIIIYIVVFYRPIGRRITVFHPHPR